MPLIDDVGVAVEIIESWFKRRCNGKWEHNLGISLTSTDNPGWWLTIADIDIDKNALAESLGELLRCFDAQVSVDNTTTRIYAPSLGQCLCASATVLTKGNRDTANDSTAKPMSPQ